MSELSLQPAESLPPTGELQELMEAAAQVAVIASRVATSFVTRGFSVDLKSDGSPVTAADRAAELAAREWIGSRFPRDAIVGEEFGTERAGAERRWYIDPIDGTRSFVRGVPLWGTLVALCEGEHVLAGAAVLSLGEDVICAAPGCGTWWNGSRCTVSSVERLDEALVLTTDESFPHSPSAGEGWKRVQRRASMSRSWGDCYGYFLVATGRAEAMADARLAEWDAACFLPIIREAGGVVTSWDGSASRFAGNLVATNAGIDRELRGLLTGDDASGAVR